MSNRHHTVEIKNFGPVTIKSLTKAQLQRGYDQIGDDTNKRLSHVLRLGLVEPKLTDDFLDSIRATPDVAADIAEAILDHSWPNKEI